MKTTSQILMLSLIFSSFTLFAQQSHTKLIEEMAWPEVREAIKNNRVLIIPLGTASKEHGPHLPMNNDLILANYLRDRVLQKLDNVLAAPTMTYHYYSTFVDYPGTISLSYQTSLGMILDTVHVLASQGFKKIYFLNTGIRTLDVLKTAKKILTSENIAMDYLDLEIPLQEDAIKKLIQQPRGSHADEVETSMMLYIAPQVVKMDRAKKDDAQKTGLPGAGLTPNPNNKTKTYSASGSWGDPTLATQEKGAVMTEALVSYIVKEINRFADSSEKTNT